MRILFLTDPVPDYLADLLYIGLCRTLGAERVVDFPLKPAYHEPERCVHYIPQVPAHRYSGEDVLAMIRDRRFDLAVCSSPRAGAINALEGLRNRVSMPPTVLIDGEDDPSIRYEGWVRSRAVVYFKRELRAKRRFGLAERWRRWMSDGRTMVNTERLRPLQLSVALDRVPVHNGSKRDVDVSYVGRVSHPLRRKAVDALRRAAGVSFEGGVYAEADDRQSKLMTGLPRLWTKLTGDPVVPAAQRGRKLSPGEYYDLLARSKMALSLRGGGFDTLRYWEIVATKTMLVSERPDIEIPHNFEHGKHAVFCRPDLRDLVELVRTYAKDEKACAEIAQRGYDHLLQYHTCERRAEYVLAMCRKMI